ncbi:hypothetical protein MP638_004049 [Amoeboaphelidium occidentale]|nr:hypothetical protein MP638_004049 [Amoeboaphelidium occidentale]
MGVVNTLHGVYLLEIFVRKFPMITTIPGSAYKLIVVALMTSNKVFDDSTYTNKTWANVTGRYVKDLNNLEREFLHCMKFSITFPLYQFEEWQRVYNRFLADNYPYAYSASEQKDQNQLLTPPLTPEERRDCLNSNFAL